MVNTSALWMKHRPAFKKHCFLLLGQGVGYVHSVHFSSHLDWTWERTPCGRRNKLTVFCQQGLPLPRSVEGFDQSQGWTSNCALWLNFRTRRAAGRLFASWNRKYYSLYLNWPLLCDTWIILIDRNHFRWIEVKFRNLSGPITVFFEELKRDEIKQNSAQFSWFVYYMNSRWSLFTFVSTIGITSCESRIQTMKIHWRELLCESFRISSACLSFRMSPRA